MTAAIETGAPAPAQRPNSRRLDAYVLSTDDAFTLEAGQVVGERLRMRPIDSPAELPQEASHPWLVLLDASQSGARALVSAIEQAHPSAPIIAIVPDAVQAQWLGAVARGSVSAIIGRGQLSAATFGDALAAVERRLNLAATAAAPARAAAATRRAAPAPAEPFRPGPLARWWPIGAGIVVLVAAAWLLFGRKHGVNDATQVAASPLAAAAATATAAGRPAASAPLPEAAAPRPVLELLSQARIAFRDQSRLLPRADGRRGDSALELYAEVLQQEPGNDEARDGVRRLGSAVQARVQSALGGGQMDDASRTVAAYKAASGDATLVQKLEADIRAAQPRWLASQAQRALAAGDLAGAEQALAQISAAGGDRRTALDVRRAIDARQADLQLQQMGDEVRAAIAGGALLEPAASSARTRLQAMRQINRSHPATLAAQRELQSALMSRASEQLQAQQFDAALRWNSAASELGATDELNEQRRRIRADMDQQAARAAAAAAAAAAPTPQPAAPPEPRYVAARATRALNVVYPESLISKGVVGYVIVEFTLQADGSARDVSVVESTPAGAFDKAATAAVARGRFDAAVLGPSKEPQRARVKLSFKP